MDYRYRSIVGIVSLSTATTGIGVWLAFRFELVLFEITPPTTWVLLAGFVEEAFVRFIPLILTFYLWSYRRNHLLSKTEGLLATVSSGLSVAGFEAILKLQYLTHLEETARFDSLVLPIVFVHLPLALLAGRFVYALGERIHGTDTIGLPSLSRRTMLGLVIGYIIVALAHIAYNMVV